MFDRFIGMLKDASRGVDINAWREACRYVCTCSMVRCDSGALVCDWCEFDMSVLWGSCDVSVSGGWMDKVKIARVLCDGLAIVVKGGECGFANKDTMYNGHKGTEYLDMDGCIAFMRDLVNKDMCAKWLKVLRGLCSHSTMTDNTYGFNIDWDSLEGASGESEFADALLDVFCRMTIAVCDKNVGWCTGRLNVWFETPGLHIDTYGLNRKGNVHKRVQRVLRCDKPVYQWNHESVARLIFGVGVFWRDRSDVVLLDDVRDRIRRA